MKMGKAQNHFLVTASPSGNFSTLMNYAYAKDREVYIRNAAEDGSDILLNQYVHKLCIECGCDELEDVSLEDFPQEITSCGLDYGDCPNFMLWVAATQAAELRGRLQKYEQAGIDVNDIPLVSRFLSVGNVKMKCLNCGKRLDLMDVINGEEVK